MVRGDVEEPLSRLRVMRRYYSIVVLAAAVTFAASIGSYYGQSGPLTVSASAQH